ncbi:MAG: HPr family phosphocarrier protein [Alphaproteobacteria bacterium]|nr:MAG: HPr family phosphocarrier protein [Alphaproteobacteria bacterium]
MAYFFEQDVEVFNKRGLHARAAAKFVETATEFIAEITVFKDSIEVSGRSIMGLLLLAAASGETIKIRGEGRDSEEAVFALVKLVKNKFHEKA